LQAFLRASLDKTLDKRARAVYSAREA
jgi:hypothetical protein